MSSGFNVGIVGATGAVGQELLQLLRERSFPVVELRPLASARSAGRKLAFGPEEVVVREATPEAMAGLDVVFFAADGAIARALAPAAVAAGALVLDKSSAYRLDPRVPLVIPEVNPSAIGMHSGIIASPNCSTAVALMALYPLHVEFGVRRVVFATYQSVSGTGVEAVEELDAQMKASFAGEPLRRRVYPHDIAFNVIPHVDAFAADGYTGEETKMRLETRKILGLPELPVTATCVRVPVVRAHSVAIHAEFERPVDVARARRAVEAFPGAELVDEPAANRYPTPLNSTRRVACAVGRLRVDTALDNGLACWVSGDNLWKGAALNSLQIAEKMAADGTLVSRRA